MTGARPAAGDDGAWLVLSVPAAPTGEELLLVDALRRVGARAVERRGERVLAWFPPPARPRATVARARAAVRASTSMADPALDWSWESQGDWARRWAEEVGPRRVTGRIVVAPVGRAVERGPSDVVVRLDPASAFGTAEHPTTRGCLRLLDETSLEGRRVLDIGTGSGILAIAAAKLGADHVLAVEADALACAAARTNAEVNGVADRLEVRHSRATAALLRRLGHFGVVAANLETGTLVRLIPAFPAVLEPRGWAVVSGVVAAERDAVAECAAAAGLAVRGEDEEEGWWTARLEGAREAGCPTPARGPDSSGLV